MLNRRLAISIQILVKLTVSLYDSCSKHRELLQHAKPSLVHRFLVNCTKNPETKGYVVNGHARLHRLLDIEPLLSRRQREFPGHSKAICVLCKLWLFSFLKESDDFRLISNNAVLDFAGQDSFLRMAVYLARFGRKLYAFFCKPVEKLSYGFHVTPCYGWRRVAAAAICFRRSCDRRGVLYCEPGYCRRWTFASIEK